VNAVKLVKKKEVKRLRKKKKSPLQQLKDQKIKKDEDAFHGLLLDDPRSMLLRIRAQAILI
jgi:hypothetical protein